MTWPETVAVLGVGTMGHGIAQQFATHGRHVTVWDESDAALARLHTQVAANVAVAIEAGALPPYAAKAAQANIAVATTLADAVTGADLVVEAVTERLEPKQLVFREAEEHAPAGAILATNTSAIDIDAIAESCADRTRVIGTHWFNPPHIVTGVEVIPGRETSDAVVTRVVEGLRSVGRIPSVARNAPGFVANRIQFAMVAEAFRCLADGVADAATIDEIVRTTFGPRLSSFGLFEIADLAGLDVYAAILDYLEAELDQPAFAPTEALREAVAAGRLGVKSGAGIYDYGACSDGTKLARDRALHRLFDPVEPSP